jgi:uncharacterized protein (TIGR03067 family)
MSFTHVFSCHPFADRDESHGETVVTNPLPHRPNLDHLRRQAKSLLVRLRAGDSPAAELFKAHLPAAASLAIPQIHAAGFRLADAQSVIARSSGFDRWPDLARHVELLRALEGTWHFRRLFVTGRLTNAQHLASSHLIIDGDQLLIRSTAGTSQGIFTIDVSTDPHHIDIDFADGPMAGLSCPGLFSFTSEQLELVVDATGRQRPPSLSASTDPAYSHMLLVRADRSTTTATVPNRPPQRPSPTQAVQDLVPMVHVYDVARSIAFYAKLGFELIDSKADPHARIFWAFLRNQSAELMLASASGPIDADVQAVLLYMNSKDVQGLREHLLQQGLRDAGEYTGRRTANDGPTSVHTVAYPPYMPAGEIRITDPDGYVILVGQLQ